MSWSAANIQWREGAGEDRALEISFPFSTSLKAVSRNISVEVADSEIIIVKLRNTRLWQARLYAAIEPEVEWSIEDGNTLILEATKKHTGEWLSLLMVPMHSRDAYLLTEAQLDQRLALEMPQWPPLEGKAVDVPVAPVKVEPFELPKASLRIDENDAKDEEFVRIVTSLFNELERSDEPDIPPVPPYEDLSELVKGVFADTDTIRLRMGKETNEESKAEETKTEESKAEETKAEETKAEESKAEETKAEESKAEETKAEETKTEETKAEETKIDEKDIDPDSLLDEALDEVNDSKPKTEAKNEEKKAEADTDEKDRNDQAVAMPSALDLRRLLVEDEIKTTELEGKNVTKRREELVEELSEKEKENPDSEECATLRKHIGIVDRMIELRKQYEGLRREPVTIKKALNLILLEIQIARTNIGSTTEHETEEFANEEEKGLSEMELFMRGTTLLNEGSIPEALHYLRLAAINKRHAPSAGALFSIYSNIPSSFPRGLDILLLNTALAPQCDPRLASKVGELFNIGIKVFGSRWALAVYFFQLSALKGSTHAMVNLALLHKIGSTLTNPFRNTDLCRHNKCPEAAKYFIEQGLKRGNTSCFLIRASQHANGDGARKDISLAKKYLKAALFTNPNLKNKPQEKILGGITVGELLSLVGMDTQKTKAEDSIEDVRLPSTSMASTSAGKGHMADPLARLAALDPGAASAAPVAVRKPAAPVTGGARAMRFWERAARVGIVGYGLYCVAFPFRVMLLPYFYETAATILDMIGLGRKNLN